MLSKNEVLVTNRLLLPWCEINLDLRTALRKHAMVSVELCLHSTHARVRSLFIQGSVLVSYGPVSWEEITLGKQEPHSPLCSLHKLGLGVRIFKALSNFASLHRSASQPLTWQNLLCLALVVSGDCWLFLLFGTLPQTPFGAPLVFTPRSFPSSARDMQFSLLGLKSVF